MEFCREPRRLDRAQLRLACVEGCLVFVVVLLPGKLARLKSDPDGGAEQLVANIFGGLGVAGDRGHSACWIAARRAQQRPSILVALESRGKIETTGDGERVRIVHHVVSQIAQFAVCLLQRAIEDRRQIHGADSLTKGIFQGDASRAVGCALSPSCLCAAAHMRFFVRGRTYADGCAAAWT